MSRTPVFAGGFINYSVAFRETTGASFDVVAITGTLSMSVSAANLAYTSWYVCMEPFGVSGDDAMEYLRIAVVESVGCGNSFESDAHGLRNGVRVFMALSIEVSDEVNSFNVVYFSSECCS